MTADDLCATIRLPQTRSISRKRYANSTARLATYKGFQVLNFCVRVGEGLKILLSQKKGEKKDGKQFLCCRTKTAHIEQLLFDPIGPFSYVLSQLCEIATKHTIDLYLLYKE